MVLIFCLSPSLSQRTPFDVWQTDNCTYNNGVWEKVCETDQNLESQQWKDEDADRMDVRSEVSKFGLAKEGLTAALAAMSAHAIPAQPFTSMTIP